MRKTLKLRLQKIVKSIYLIDCSIRKVDCRKKLILSLNPLRNQRKLYGKKLLATWPQISRLGLFACSSNKSLAFQVIVYILHPDDEVQTYWVQKIRRNMMLCQLALYKENLISLSIVLVSTWHHLTKIKHSYLYCNIMFEWSMESQKDRSPKCDVYVKDGSVTFCVQPYTKINIW